MLIAHLSDPHLRTDVLAAVSVPRYWWAAREAEGVIRRPRLSRPALIGGPR